MHPANKYAALRKGNLDCEFASCFLGKIRLFGSFFHVRLKTINAHIIRTIADITIVAKCHLLIKFGCITKKYVFIIQKNKFDIKLPATPKINANNK